MLSKIRSCALDFLARREHSKFELQQKLSKKGFAACDIKKLLEELAIQGLQSDNRFAESYVNMRLKRGFGPVRIAAELNERGIDSEQGGNFLRSSDAQWFERARSTRDKKFGIKIPNQMRERAKQMRYLYYKGFTSEHIKQIFNYEQDL